jgi:tripeptidyl-peptidase I
MCSDIYFLSFYSVSQTDLTNFLKKYRPDAASYQIPIKNAGGGTNDPSMPGIEAMLDVETVISQNYPLKTEFLYYGGQTGDIFQQGLAYYLNNYTNVTRPGVISVSYGDIEQDFTASQASTFCSTAQKLTAQGTTVVFASGDNGVDSVQASSAPSCSNGFVPTYPSGCPYILSVGGLQNFSPEVAVDTTLAGFWGGSGFSTLFTVPSYQTSAQKAYVSKLGSTASGYYNKNGRAFPDVSAQASNYIIASGGSFYTVGGTSAAAPTISAILSLVNDARRKAGKARIGWVQPTIYANGGLTDITSGKALGCPSPQQNIGLLVESGYDAVTGLGSPQFAALRSVFGV